MSEKKTKPIFGDGERTYLTETIGLYQRLVDFTGDAVYRYTYSEGRILFANQGLVDILDLKCSSKDLIGKFLKDILIYTQEPGTVRRAANKNGEIHNFEYHFKTLSGKDRWVIHDSFITKDPISGEKVVEAIVKDISHQIKRRMERLKAENELKKSEQEYRQLVANSLVGIYKTDIAGNYLFINTAYASLLGYDSPDDFVGKSVIDRYKNKGDRKVFLRMLKKDGKVDNFVKVVYTKDRQVKTLLSSAVLDNGIISGMSIDITELIRTQDELRESRDFSENLIETANVMIISLDKHGKIMRFNNFSEKLTGYTKEEVIGKSWFKLFIPKKDRKDIPRIFRSVLNQMIDHSTHENPIITKNNDERLISWNNTVLKNKKGHITGVLSIGSDITDEKNALMRITQLNEFLTYILDHAPVGIVTTNIKGDITNVNKALIKMLGSPSEKKTKDFNVLKLRTMRKYGISDAFKNVLSNGKPVNLVRVRYTSMWGKELICQLKIVPLKQKKRITGSLAIINDVTKQAKLEDKIFNVKEHLETVINGIDEAIVVIDKKYRIISHNNAFIQSLRDSREVIPGMNCFSVIHNYSKSCRNCVLRDMFKTGEPKEDIHYHIEDGHKIYHEVKTYPLKDSSGKVKQAVYVFRDVTEREVLFERIIHAKEAAERLAKMESDFVSIASHEVRTPLAIIKGYAEVLSDGSIGTVNKQQKIKLGSIIRNIDRLNNLVEKLLHLSKFESEQMSLHIDTIDFRRLVESVKSEMQAMIKQKNISLKISIKKKTPKIKLDSILIKQVLFNLIDNAIKFTPNDGIIKINASVKDKKLHLIVSDTGIGIPKKELSKIGGMFYQVDTSVSRKYKGTGLGLAICKRILDLHGGSMKIKSTLGKGTRVTVIVPV